MPHANSFSTFSALMLRGWKEPSKDPRQAQWHFRVRNLKSGEQHGFANLDALLDFLRREFNDQAGTNRAEDTDQK